MRRRRGLPSLLTIFIIAIIFTSIGFILAYYQFSGQMARERLDREEEERQLQALIEGRQDKIGNLNENPNEDRDIIVTRYRDTIDSNTSLIYKTLYSQCDHIVEEEGQVTEDLIGLNREGFQEYLISNQTGWEIESFEKVEITLLRQVNGACPDHYLVSVKGAYIAVYKYDKDNKKKLIEETDIAINILPIVDQEKLQKGILLETRQEVNKLLEDYSS